MLLIMTSHLEHFLLPSSADSVKKGYVAFGKFDIKILENTPACAASVAGAISPGNNNFVEVFLIYPDSVSILGEPKGSIRELLNIFVISCFIG
jgi:hypothetical protein